MGDALVDAPSPGRDPPCRGLLSGVNLAHATQARFMVDNQPIFAPFMAIQLSLALQRRNGAVCNNRRGRLRILGLAAAEP